MPTKVRIISPRNSAAWDDLVAGILESVGLGKEQTYGGITSEQRADEVRRKIRTAAKRRDLASKVFWGPCDKPGSCEFGADCTHHVKMTFFSMEEGRAYKAKQAQQRR